MKLKSSPRDDCEDIDHCREGENKQSEPLRQDLQPERF